MTAHTLGLGLVLALPLALVYAVVLGWEFFRVGLWIAHAIDHIQHDEDPCLPGAKAIALHLGLAVSLLFGAVFLMVVGIR